MDSSQALRVVSVLKDWAREDPLLRAQLRAAENEVNVQILVETIHQLYQRIQELEADNVTHLDDIYVDKMPEVGETEDDTTS